MVDAAGAVQEPAGAVQELAEAVSGDLEVLVVEVPLVELANPSEVQVGGAFQEAVVEIPEDPTTEETLRQLGLTTR